LPKPASPLQGPRSRHGRVRIPNWHCQCTCSCYSQTRSLTDSLSQLPNQRFVRFFGSSNFHPDHMTATRSLPSAVLPSP
jgi:hypothetical protein